jgi:hypothetical protein
VHNHFADLDKMVIKKLVYHFLDVTKMVVKRCFAPFRAYARNVHRKIEKAGAPPFSNVPAFVGADVHSIMG